MTDLTNEKLRRQNILNNRYALQAAERHLALGGVTFAGETVFTKQQVTLLFEISDATVERYIATHGDELRANGYTLLRGKKLNEFKDLGDVALINEGNKRSSIALGAYFLKLNGYDYVVRRFVLEMENIAVYVAASAIDRALLRRIVESLLYEEDYSEALKLDLITAISPYAGEN